MVVNPVQATVQQADVLRELLDGDVETGGSLGNMGGGALVPNTHQWWKKSCTCKICFFKKKARRKEQEVIYVPQESVVTSLALAGDLVSCVCTEAECAWILCVANSKVVYALHLKKESLGAVVCLLLFEMERDSVSTCKFSECT